jgi:hypothetical protein
LNSVDFILGACYPCGKEKKQPFIHGSFPPNFAIDMQFEKRKLK